MREKGSGSSRLAIAGQALALPQGCGECVLWGPRGSRAV